MAALLLVAASCVSGSSDDATVHVAFNPATLRKSIGQGDTLTTGMTFLVSFSRAPDGPWFPRVQAPAPAFEPGVLVVGSSATATMLSLTPYCGLDPGEYTGTVTVDLCRDEACTATYALSGNTVPYALTVSPGLLVTASVDGVPEPGFKTLCGVGGLGGSVGRLYDFSAVSGQTVALASTVPVTWSASLGEVGCGLTLNAVSTTETSWTATIESSSPGYGCGFVYVEAAPDPSHWINIDISVGPF